MEQHTPGHVPSTQATPGPYVARGASLWSADGVIQIANCAASRNLCPKGHAANARALAHGSEALELIRDLALRKPDAMDRIYALLCRADGPAPPPVARIPLRPDASLTVEDIAHYLGHAPMDRAA